MQMSKEQAVKYVQQLESEIKEAERSLREQGSEALMPIQGQFLGQREDKDGMVWHRFQRPSGHIWELPAKYNPEPQTPKSAWDNALCSLDLRVHQKILSLVSNERQAWSR
jgi:hypothetical protein